MSDLEEENKRLKQEIKELKKKLKKYTNPGRNKKYYQNNKKKCIERSNKRLKNLPKGKNLKLFNEFIEYNIFNKEYGKNLSQILNYNAISILTAIENNIKCHYFDYVRRYVNSYFKHVYQNELKNKEFKQRLFKELKKVKNDIIGNTLTCNAKYHKWLKKNRYNIILQEFHKNGYHYDVKSNPQKYIKCMIWMNIELEKIEGKMYQFFPLRTSEKPRFCPIDTKSLIEIFVKKK
jgi:hypothetical protein